MAQMTGGEAVVQALRQEGVEVVFGLPGVQIMEIYDAFHGQSDIGLITVRIVSPWKHSCRQSSLYSSLQVHVSLVLFRGRSVCEKPEVLNHVVWNGSRQFQRLRQCAERVSGIANVIVLPGDG